MSDPYLDRLLDSYKQMDHGWCYPEKATELYETVLSIDPALCVEIGAYSGRSCFAMGMAAVQLEGPCKVIGIDAWDNNIASEYMEGVNKTFWGEEVPMGKVYEDATRWRGALGLNHIIDYKRGTSLDIFCEAYPQKWQIDLLHIDGDHSEEMSFQDVYLWTRLVPSGGTIVFDDEDWTTTKKAVQYLNTICRSRLKVKGDNICGFYEKL